MAEIYSGEVKGGVVVFDPGTPPLPEGTKVRVEPADMEEAIRDLSRRLLSVAGRAKGLPPDSRESAPLPGFLGEQDGEVRLAGHRVSLEHLLAFYREGYSAEMLREQFPTLPMALIQKALAYYWEHKAELDAEAARSRARLDAARAAGDRLDVAALRERLAADPAARASD